jgi:hypothetical protein
MNQDTNALSVDSWQTITSGIVLGTIGVLSFIVQPGLVQGFVTELGLSEAVANELAFSEMLGVALATCLSIVMTRKLNWRWMLSVALVIAVIGNLTSLLLLKSHLLGFARFTAGLGEGVVISLSFTVIGLTKRTERNLALYLVLLLSYGALGLWLMPLAFDRIGLEGIFAIWAILTALSLVCVRYVPQSSQDHITPRETAVTISATMRGLALLGVLLFNLAIGIAWANLFLIGMLIEPDEQKIANALLLCQFIAIGGAVIPVFLEQKLGVIVPIAVCILGSAAFMSLLLGNPDYLVFTIVVCVFNFLWNMGLPFILSSVGEMDLSGTMVTNAIAIQMTGLGFGPLLAAFVLGQQGTFREVEVLIVSLYLISMIPLFIAILAHHRVLKTRGGPS